MNGHRYIDPRPHRFEQPGLRENGTSNGEFHLPETVSRKDFNIPGWVSDRVFHLFEALHIDAQAKNLKAVDLVNRINQEPNMEASIIQGSVIKVMFKVNDHEKELENTVSGPVSSFYSVFGIKLKKIKSDLEEIKKGRRQ